MALRPPRTGRPPRRDAAGTRVPRRLINRPPVRENIRTRPSGLINRAAYGAEGEGPSAGGGHVHGERSEAEQQVASLLQTARRKLDLSVAFLSRIDETTRTMQVVDSELT